MVITVDIGNTNIVFGFFEQGMLLSTLRIVTDSGRTSDEYRLLISQFMREEKLNSKVEDFVVSSVVPSLTPVFRAVARKIAGKEAILINSDLSIGIKFEVDEPRFVGADRICDIFEAHKLFPNENAVTVDFGTATTFSVITKDSRFIGGPITIGVLPASTELFRKTAQLPRIELVKPKSAIGRNTVEEMQSGVINGFGGLVDRLIELIEDELGEKVRVIGTGGISHIMEGVSRRIEIFDKLLTVKGMYSIYEYVNGK
ncbi:type III pantothenate kinase [Caldisericum exile]|uniref:type III pantothenate kinase n=1 Tax=Caldisericum exile TaxID=693075 RepID=UPI003C752B46